MTDPAIRIEVRRIPRDPEMVAIELCALHAWALELNELDDDVREIVLAVAARAERQMLDEWLGGDPTPN